VLGEEESVYPVQEFLPPRLIEFKAGFEGFTQRIAGLACEKFHKLA
jgi:hypothetical protein